MGKPQENQRKTREKPKETDGLTNKNHGISMGFIADLCWLSW